MILSESKMYYSELYTYSDRRTILKQKFQEYDETKDYMTEDELFNFLDEKVFNFCKLLKILFY